jgi:hypothetical protein
MEQACLSRETFVTRYVYEKMDDKKENDRLGGTLSQKIPVKGIKGRSASYRSSPNFTYVLNLAGI